MDPMALTAAIDSCLAGSVDGAAVHAAAARIGSLTICGRNLE